MAASPTITAKLQFDLSDYVEAANKACRELAEAAQMPTQFVPEEPCPYCSRPEGWDACPVHRDGRNG